METRRIYLLIWLCWFSVEDISNGNEHKGVDIGSTCKHDSECRAGNGGEYSKCNGRLSICICTVDILGDDRCQPRVRTGGRMCKHKPLYTEKDKKNVCATECSAKGTWELPDDMDWYGYLSEQFSSVYVRDKKTSACYDPERAIHSVPDGFVIKNSSIPNAGLGVFTEMYIQRETVFGPYKGIFDYNGGTGYSWTIYKDEVRQEQMFVDASHEYLSNWLRYINAPVSAETENIVPFQHKGHMYYMALKAIPPGTELLVSYGKKYAKRLGIKYFKSPKYAHAKSGYAGGLCTNVGKSCRYDKNTICVRGWCFCIRGSHRRAGFCILDETLGGICAGSDGETCKHDKYAECKRGVCVCKNSSTPARGVCIPDEFAGGRCTGPNGQDCMLDSNAECVHGLCHCKYGTSLIEQACKSSNIRLFADDTSLYIVVDNPVTAAETLNSDLMKIDEWANEWLVDFNPKKQNHFLFLVKTTKTESSSLFANSFLPSTVSDWNQLPLDHRDSPTLGIFTRRLYSDVTKVPSHYYVGERVDIGSTCKHDSECTAGNGGEYSKCNRRLSLCICTVNILGDDRCQPRVRSGGRVCKRKPLYTEEEQKNVCAMECSAKG
ncbi:uncharacterized protein LOC123525311 [Mercenaria mercenaria]|uniref:uncharacterized protein LOC123525311 n=1 Tax=Mercenaria mercenaria TaxID=6596 RepID=UPI00234E42FA|nr:uncharacterized protein LOC123525311 [Mercenaria mercenaria]